MDPDHYDNLDPVFKVQIHQVYEKPDFGARFRDVLEVIAFSRGPFRGIHAGVAHHQYQLPLHLRQTGLVTNFGR